MVKNLKLSAKNLKLKMNQYRFDTIISSIDDIKNIHEISSHIIVKDLPTNFKGQEVWKDYLSPVSFQGTCGSCWAWATATCLSNRLKLKTLNRLQPELSAVFILLCDISFCKGVGKDKECLTLEGSEFDLGKINVFYADGILQKGCTGNTLENVWKFLYKFGTVEKMCVDYEISKVDEEKILPICDISGSMCGLPMEISVSLGIYLSERNKSVFKDDVALIVRVSPAPVPSPIVSELKLLVIAEDRLTVSPPSIDTSFVPLFCPG